MAGDKNSTSRYRLGNMMVRDKIITEEQLQQVLEFQKIHGNRLGRILRDLGFVTEEILSKYLSQQLGMPIINLANVEISQEVLKIIPEFLVRRHNLIPISKTIDSIVIVMSDPLDIFAIDDVTLRVGNFKVKPSIAKEADISAAIEKYYGKSKGIKEGSDEAGYTKPLSDDIESILKEANEMKLVGEGLGRETPIIDISKIARDTEAAPIIRLVNYILLEAINARASDIHIEPYEKRLRVRYRIDGVLHEILSPSKNIQTHIVARLKIITHLNIAEHRLPQDGRCKVNLEGRSVDLRISATPTVFGEKIVIRLLDPKQLALNLNSLGFDSGTLELYKNYIRSPHGIILVTGPTGSGKTTTLYATLVDINSEDKNIMTVEDPVEYILDGVNQQQIKPEIGLDFVEGLRSFLRQDPDVIMLGEIRDIHTAEVAINAALTGHLVFSTLHTNDAVGAVIRLLNMGTPSFLIASSLIISLAQRLMRTLCPNCKTPYEISSIFLKEIGINVEEENITLYRAAGCKECVNTGYSGRIGIYEIMVMSDRIREMIFEKASDSLINEVACKEGMIPLRVCASQKVLSGITSVEEYLRVT